MRESKLKYAIYLPVYISKINWQRDNNNAENKPNGFVTVNIIPYLVLINLSICSNIYKNSSLNLR